MSIAISLLVAFALHLLLATLPAIADEAPVGIACARAGQGVEASICEHPELLEADKRIAITFSRLRAAFQGEDAASFVAGQKLWLIERNYCANTKATGEFPDISSCLANRMEERAALLEHLAPTHEALMATVANYRFVEPAYVIRFADAYAGHEVKVVGSLLLDACDGRHAASLDGLIQHRSGSLTARFAQLDQERIEALCHQKPFAWWPGRIQLEHGKPYLLVSESR
ncbi:lysozyme inhibitor LprI family protein [Dyella koreensis]|uniref:Lysozyme inhibitor LprI N-terminal domain-containing protein n=1 Tax=Dyella koreensis TaxID=311235 RepID=A0ABW8K8C1_9GAMM